jgi:hypothetical protein
MRGKLAIKNLAIGFSRFITRRGKLVVLLIALLTVLFLAVLFSGYMLFDITSNYQSSNTIPNQSSITTPDELSTNISNQGKIAFLNQPSNNSSNPSETTDSDAGVLKAIGIGAYWDPGLTSKVSTTDWGLLQPGAQKSFTVYVHNEGNSPVTLSLSTSNWTTSTASAYLALTWNYNGQTIGPSAQMQVTLTLTVSSNITGISNFSFDIIIAASS